MTHATMLDSGGVLRTVVVVVVVAAAAICSVASAEEAAPPSPPVVTSHMTSVQEQQQHTAWMAGQRPVCRALYETRRFVSPREGAEMGENWCPALLWTYLGSGDTIVCMLIEIASGSV